MEIINTTATSAFGKQSSEFPKLREHIKFALAQIIRDQPFVTHSKVVFDKRDGFFQPCSSSLSLFKIVTFEAILWYD
jgi:hypothetical protein